MVYECHIRRLFVSGADLDAKGTNIISLEGDVQRLRLGSHGLLLLLELLAARLDGDAHANLCLLLWRELVSVSMLWIRDSRSTYCEVINLSAKCGHDGTANTLLKQAAKLALGVDLGTEGRESEVVLGTESRDTILLETTAHHTASTTGAQGKRHIDTSLDLVGDAPPVRGVEGTLRLQSGGSDPVVGLITADV